jgi:hypothetical protein
MKAQQESSPEFLVHTGYETALELLHERANLLVQFTASFRGESSDADVPADHGTVALLRFGACHHNHALPSTQQRKVAWVLLAGFHATAFLSRDGRRRSFVPSQHPAKPTRECHRRTLAGCIVVQLRRYKLLLGLQDERLALVRRQPRRTAGSAGLVRSFACGDECEWSVALTPERVAQPSSAV